MRIWDISLRLRHGTSSWPGDGRALRQRWLSSIAEGADANTTAFEGSVHLGTHIDAPLHFVDGSSSVAEVALDRCVGPATVVEIDGIEQIDIVDLEAALSEPWPRRILFKTRNSAPGGCVGAEDFDADYCAITVDAARSLVDRGVELVGIDAASIAPFDDVVPTHRVLLGAGVVVVEGLDLRDVEPGEFTLVALPLRLGGFEGSPVRAVLIRED
jgi:arylformamidase